MAMKRALITGVAGQDGSYLAEFLLAKGYEVHGVCRHGETPVDHRVHVHMLDLRESHALAHAIRDIQPDECYHLAAHHRSSSATSKAMDQTEEDRITFETNLGSTVAILQTLAEMNSACRIFIAASCHVFGNTTQTPQTERTPFAPANLYGITKAASMMLARTFRRQTGLFACSGILYQHESPLRGPAFLSSRIVRAAVETSRGHAKPLHLGDVDASVDWGFAGDYVRAMHRMLQADTPEDFIIASGKPHRIRDFAEIAFRRVGLDWKEYVTQDPAPFHPVGAATYHGDITAIRTRLGWEPTTSFQSLVEMMVDAELTNQSSA